MKYNFSIEIIDDKGYLAGHKKFSGKIETIPASVRDLMGIERQLRDFFRDESNYKKKKVSSPWL